MSKLDTYDVATVAREIEGSLLSHDLSGIVARLSQLQSSDVTAVLERMSTRDRAVVFRVLSKSTALDVFEAFDPAMQKDLVSSLKDSEVASIFADLDPDDRVWLLDELPASLASKLMRGLSESERKLTTVVLGYPHSSVGRRMSSEYFSVRPDWTVGSTLSRLRNQLGDDTSFYSLPVTNEHRKLLGVVSLRSLILADDDMQIQDILDPVPHVLASEDAEAVARDVLERGVPSLPIVDSESRLVGIFVMDDAARILEREESEDSARQGGVEPLHRPYLSTSILSIVRSRVVWLFALAIGASLTVQVLSAFEATLEQLTVLALFVPLLIGTGGNTGNQAATTVTRALALDDVRVQDIAKVFGRELRVGLSLGLLLGGIGFTITGLIYGTSIGLVIGLTLIAVCTMAATVGGIMPLIAKSIKVDPAVFSNPFITTFVDAAGLLVYFLIAQSILGL